MGGAMQPFKRLLFVGLLILLASVPLASAFAQNEVTFQVDMRVVMYHEFFQPQNGDLIVLRSSVDGWAEDNARVMSDPEGDSVYTLAMNLPEGPIEYKFFKTPRADISLEGNVDPGNPPDGNRRYTVVAGSQTLPVASFNNFDEYSDLVSVNVTFQVEMGPYIALGMFNPATDQVGLPSLFPEPLTPSRDGLFADGANGRRHDKPVPFQDQHSRGPGQRVGGLGGTGRPVWQQECDVWNG